MTSKPQCVECSSDDLVVTPPETRIHCRSCGRVQMEASKSAEALRAKHERIGRLVCERTSELKALLLSLPDVCAHYEGPAMCGIVLGTAAIQAILKEVDA